MSARVVTDSAGHVSDGGAQRAKCADSRTISKNARRAECGAPRSQSREKQGGGNNEPNFSPGRRGSERHHEHRERLQKGRADPLLDVAKPRCATRDAAPAHTASRSLPTAPQRNGYPGTCFFCSRAPTKCCCPGASGLLARLPAASAARSCSALRAFLHRAPACDHPMRTGTSILLFAEMPGPGLLLFVWLLGCACLAAAAARSCSAL